ncbi:DUF3800 domain-containing protein [Patescibacteria group bacterium]|nr:DUF3800 domain-containing protein [Patescibacteria group bacterium]MBU1256340.1 DUF3800 domain-containing protein [Patescibacteria group bacterium]MBU1457368.1 DUF3800 domain-containing protein [Patescibacteria group bacterium]
MHYLLFIDESGESNLNHKGRYFILSSILIAESDFQIIQGYMRLIKRKYLDDDLKNIHTTDLFERTYMKYRKLIKPTKRLLSFLDQLFMIVKNTPFSTGLYYVDKDQLRLTLKYVPAKNRKPHAIDLNLPYEMASLQAFFDFSDYLAKEKATGEIIVESRLHNDGDFVGYFDLARKKVLPGGVVNSRANTVKENINSLTISNKRVVNSGLELADMAGYSVYRKFNGDPFNKINTEIGQVLKFTTIFKKKSYLTNKSGNRIGLKKVPTSKHI